MNRDGNSSCLRRKQKAGNLQMWFDCYCCYPKTKQPGAKPKNSASQWRRYIGQERTFSALNQDLTWCELLFAAYLMRRALLFLYDSLPFTKKSSMMNSLLN